MRRVAFGVALVLGACKPSHHSPDAGFSPTEAQIRDQLGIPSDAPTVIVLGQAAHLDIDWQRTFVDYYQSFVQDIFTEARQVVGSEPRAFYSVAEMGFLQHHLVVHPEEAAPLQAAAARGALRIVGGGLTSPDTVLPETEILLRDFLYGTQFAEGTLGTRPTSAWLPDSFGHAATAPDILAACGFDSVAFSRIDGAPTILQVLRDPQTPPLPGSTAEQLRQLGTNDFVWQGPGGGTVIAHWLSSFLYCQGDNIDYDESIEVPGGHIGPFMGDSTLFTDKRIQGYVASLKPYAKTPYLFVPVGCDFQHPKDRLISYLDGYNQRHASTDGVWAVAAPFDLYVQLVKAHQDALPTLATDLTPYFMGFYGSRPGVKRLVRQAARPLFSAETFAVALQDGGQATMTAIQPELTQLALSDHHDFITGTSNDTVVATEQLPFLETLLAEGQAAFDGVAGSIARGIPALAGSLSRAVVFNASSATRSEILDLALPSGVSPAVHAVAGTQPIPTEVLPSGNGGYVARMSIDQLPPFAWRAVDLLSGSQAVSPVVSVQVLGANGQPATGAAATQVILQSTRVRAEWDRLPNIGVALTSLQLDGTEMLQAPSFTLNDYDDQGGLWRLGNEMPGCSLAPIPASPGEILSESIAVTDQSALSATVTITSSTSVREARLDAGAAGLFLALTSAAPLQGTLRTASFDFAVTPGAPLRTSLAGGYAERPVQHVYTPTFWPAVAWVTTGNAAVLLRQSTGVTFSAAGHVELMSARDARVEQCDYEGGTGSDPDTHRFEWFVTQAASPADAELAAQAFNRPLSAVALSGNPDPGASLPPEQSLVSVQGAGVISALKPAERGQGIILRALLLPGPLTVTIPSAWAQRELVRTDAVERDIADLGTAGTSFVLDRDHFGAIATVRLR